MQSEPSATPPGVSPPAPPRSNRNRNLLIGGGCALVVLCLLCVGGIAVTGGLAAFGIGAAFGPVETAANNFMSGLRDGNWQQAYSQMDPALQREVGNVSQFQQLITRGQAVPESWNWTRRDINNDIADWSGSAQFKTGRSGTVELRLRRSGDDWKVISFDLQPR
ncbi:MAG: hypothetical protein RMM58_06510 [Chloroflexota bacterium]|nr:hypothetical protein [Dehalococcoidia bacterium]MDW8253513.1 hypothetical protein [Chloroflexota bacterium]